MTLEAENKNLTDSGKASAALVAAIKEAVREAAKEAVTETLAEERKTRPDLGRLLRNIFAAFVSDYDKYSGGKKNKV